ncbi:MauE/DoxX family redox-associated membrane protein [Chitinophaga pollutisoli]|uniref:MauE/DoxX family redox-associated membrane protein n=1 Tax=Chitinophaga pollutisoli TaxID=3133966 RepID=A0ABZ2YN68_9BACT
MKSRKTFVLITTLLFIALWGYTALSKIFGFEIFEDQLSLSPVFKSTYRIVAVAVPAVELVLLALLIFERTKIAGLLLSALLLLAFTIYLAYILLNYQGELPCTCGGFIAKMTWTQHIIFNITFILLAISALIVTRQTPQKHTAALS